MSPELHAELLALEPGRGLVAGDIPNEAYHSGIGLSCSGAKRLLVTPYHFHALTLPRDVPMKGPTAAMFNGTLVHCALLEREQFAKRYRVSLAEDKRTKEYRSYVQLGLEEGFEVITFAQHWQAFSQADALAKLPDIAHLLSIGQAEKSVYWRDVAHGVLCKCRPDHMTPVAHDRGIVLLDVKTTTDASAEGFAKACANYSYHLQAAWYCEGVRVATGREVHGMVFAVVESEFPYACATYMLGDESLRKGREAMQRALGIYAQCDKAQAWPGYPQQIQVIDLPRWA
jgi:hypothetical protein